MNKIIFFSLLILAVSSCKKDKDEFVPTTVKNAEGLLEYIPADGKNNTNWYSIKAMDGLSIQSINNDPVWQQSIVFGYYNAGNEYGIYSPGNYPEMYGQENWQVRHKVFFKKTKISADQMQQYRDQYKDGFPVQLILDKWKTAISLNTHIANPKEGETYAFRTTDGKLTGLIQIQNLNTSYTNTQFEIWIAQ